MGGSPLFPLGIMLLQNTIRERLSTMLWFLKESGEAWEEKVTRRGKSETDG
jgi:hypothetical protein